MLQLYRMKTCGVDSLDESSSKLRSRSAKSTQLFSAALVKGSLSQSFTAEQVSTLYNLHSWQHVGYCLLCKFAILVAYSWCARAYNFWETKLNDDVFDYFIWRKNNRLFQSTYQPLARSATKKQPLAHSTSWKFGKWLTASRKPLKMQCISFNQTG